MLKFFKKPFVKMFRAIKKLGYKHYISWAILICLGLWVAFSSEALIRFIETARDLGTSFLDLLFYDKEWCPEVTLKAPSSVNIDTLFPNGSERLSTFFKVYFSIFFDKYNLFEWLLWLLPMITTFSQLFLICLLLFGIVYLLKKLNVFKSEINNDHGKKSRPRKIYERFEKYALVPAVNFIKGCWSFFYGHKVYGKLLWVAFLLGSNLLSILFEFLSLYFYFVGTFDVFTLAIYLYKLSVDSIIAYRSLPLLLWLYLAWRLFDKVTRLWAKKRLYFYEALNKAVVKMLGLVIFIFARMRGGKTKLATSMMTTWENVAREDALDNMLQVHRHFPGFPFELYVQALTTEIQEDRIYSLESADNYVNNLEAAFREKPEPSQLFGYDFEFHGEKYDNGIVMKQLFDELRMFAESFTVYTEPTLIFSNYSVRELGILNTLGNFPGWNHSYFDRPSYNGDGEFSRIIDHDCLRPGKKMKPENKSYGAVEYACIGEAEIDKERGNKNDKEDIKRKDSRCNVKNDLHNKDLKMRGHGAMINYKCFFKMFSDAQRKDSWEADGVQLSQTLEIKETSEEFLALRFFGFRDMIYRLALKLHKSTVFKRWYNRGDCPLLPYLIDKLLCSICNYGERVYNTFGYKKQLLLLGEGTASSDKEKEEVVWYSINAKENADVYATDAFQDYYRTMNRNSRKGLSSFERYNSVHPKLKSMRQRQNSHMLNSFTEENNIQDEN